MSGNLSSDQHILETIFNPEHPIVDYHPHDDIKQHESVDVDIPQEVKDLEKVGVRQAEEGDLSGALDQLTRVLELVPNYASGYNNRAQVYRLLNKVDEALSDLNTAIQLSGGCGKAAENAFTQRGLILMLRGNEDDALEDFKAAATLGNKFAQSQVVKLNPYAKLCNQMLTEAIEKLQDGYQK